MENTDKSDKNFIIFGHNCKDVFKNIWNKKKNPKRDDIKLGLVVEGGGMRGIIAGGIIVALHQLGLNKVFNYVYGSSAGAVGGAYFLAGQSPYAISIYYEDINNRNFINLLQVPQFFNIDYLIDVVKNKKKLDIEAIKNNPGKLIVTATEIESGKPKYFSDFENIDLLQAIKASCALPIYYDKPVEINGKQYLDGGIVTPLPISKAIKDGCTDILILMTDKKNRHRHPKLPLWFEIWRLKKYGRNFISSYYARHKFYKKIIEIIENDGEKKNINLAAITPLNSNIKSITINKKKLKNAYIESYKYALNIFNKYKPKDIEI